MKKLTELVKEDPRIKKVYEYAKEKYDESNLTQHNFEHIIRVLYRALLISSTEKNVNLKILIPATLLHDIGKTTKTHKNHAEVGVHFVKQILPKFGYSQQEIEAICHCILTHNPHKAVNQLPKTLEAKILYDSDALEKSDLPSFYFHSRAQYESKVPLEKFNKFVTVLQKKRIKHGFYTKKASEIDNGGLKERLKLHEDISKILKKRKDIIATENDVW